MAITVKHSKVSTIPDDADTSLVRPSDWNADHTLVGLGTMAEQNANNVNITGGSITGVTGVGDVVGPASSTDNAVARFDSTTGKLIQNSGVTIDDNNNITANALDDGYLNTAASGTPIVLTSASVRRYTITGSGGQTIKLPDATTLPNGTVFQFDNNQSSGAITVNNNSNTLIVSVPSGGFILVNLLSNAIAAGSWDRHDQAPANVSWSTNTFDYAGSITSATWNGATVAVNRGGTGVTTSTGSGSNVLNTSPTLTTPAITGGTIDNTVIGGTTPAAGTFTTITGQTEVLKGTGQNFITYSQLIGGTNWTNSGTATSSTNTGATTDPLGGNTASLISNATDVTFGGNNVRQTPAVLPNTAYAFSAYIKFGTATTVSVGLRDGGTGSTTSITTTTASAWTRITGTITTGASTTAVQIQFGGANGTFYAWGAQFEFGSTVNSYIATTSSIVYGTPTLSFSGVAGLGLQSDGSLYVSPAGTGALQAQATTSSATGGNARGANAVDWQTSRGTAAQVASGQYATIGGGSTNTSNNTYSTVAGGGANQATNYACFVGGGYGNVASTDLYSAVVGGNANIASGRYSGIVSGNANTATGIFGLIGGGFTNSTTANAAVTTATTTIALTAATTVYLTATNASVKVGQWVQGTGVSSHTYATSTVTTGTAAVMNTSTISGTTLTVGSLASGTIIAGMVLTGTGVTAGTYIVSGSASTWTVSVSQTVASTTITGTAYTFTISQNATTAAGVTLSFYTPHGVVVGGGNNQATGSYSFIGGGGDAGTAANRNVASGDWSAILGGRGGTTRGITGFQAFPACSIPIASGAGYSQGGLLVLGTQTTNATATVITSDGLVASTSNQVILPNNSAYFFTGEVIAGVTGGGNTKGWTIEGVIKRGANAAATSIVGTATVTSTYADAGAATWAVTATANTTLGGLAITVTGQAATTIRWVAQIRTTEMTY
jgi:hypothetical protein